MTARVLDLFCCAGGAGKGYMDAGFEVTGVDIVDRPNYPEAFIKADALAILNELVTWGDGYPYDLIHASPPCQADCSLTVGTNASRSWGGEHESYTSRVRTLLDRIGLPYVIEQPSGRSGLRRDVTLCGEMFGLGVLRHRHFELGGWTAVGPAHVPHRGKVRGWRHGVYHHGPYVAAYGSGGGKATVLEMQTAMRLWHTDVREELTEAIPPAYTEWLGKAWLAGRAS